MQRSLHDKDQRRCTFEPYAEAALLEEYESAHAFEDESLAALVEHWQEHEVKSTLVIRPEK